MEDQRKKRVAIRAESGRDFGRRLRYSRRHMLNNDSLQDRDWREAKHRVLV